jgi:hypothetical protein
MSKKTEPHGEGKAYPRLVATTQFRPSLCHLVMGRLWRMKQGTTMV